MFYDTNAKKAKEFNFVKDPLKPRKRKRKAPNYSILQYFDGAESSADIYRPDTLRAYIREIYYEVIDSMYQRWKHVFINQGTISMKSWK